jgi:phenylalanyl-tRNA synthetase beta chain
MEEMLLSGAFEGEFVASKWQQNIVKVDFYLVKGILDTLASKLGVEFSYEANKNLKNMHPGRCANILLNNEVLGFIGEVHPRYQRDNDLTETYVFELSLDKLFSLLNDSFNYEIISKYPEVSRDLAIVCKKEITAKQIIDIIKMVSRKNLVSLNVFDLYEGENVGAEEKSIALNLVFGSKEKTLSTEDVDKIIHSIVNRLEQLLGARLR